MQLVLAERTRELAADQPRPRRRGVGQPQGPAGEHRQPRAPGEPRGAGRRLAGEAVRHPRRPRLHAGGRQLHGQGGPWLQGVAQHQADPARRHVDQQGAAAAEGGPDGEARHAPFDADMAAPVAPLRRRGRSGGVGRSCEAVHEIPRRRKSSPRPLVEGDAGVVRTVRRARAVPVSIRAIRRVPGDPCGRRAAIAGSRATGGRTPPPRGTTRRSTRRRR